MNKIATITLIASLMIPSPFIFTSCSDNTTDEIIDDEQKNPAEGLIEIPQEVLEKVHKIYSKATTGPQEVRTVNQLAILTSLCATRKGDGPISVTNALLNKEKITLVTLGGTEDVEGQATTMKESQQAAFGKSNDYLTAVTRLFEDGIIPQGKPVMVTGISLGGMIAQQLLGQKNLLEQFDIRAIITFGSPITLPLDRQGVKVVRFADKHDKVPELGETMLRSGMITLGQMNKKELTKKLDALDKAEKISCTSKYTDMIETHALSYIEDACWNATDFMGDPAKGNILELEESMHFHQAPQLAEKE